MTRERYTKSLIGVAIGNMIGIFLTPYLFGRPWSEVPMMLMAMTGGLAIYVLCTWRWPTDGAKSEKVNDDHS